MAGPSNFYEYRPDIDGLRAVAVLSVIAFHLSGDLLPGGFVGVDVFFVISGYLITGHILRDIEAGIFSVAEFYRRRIKRIAPALLVVVAATMIAAQFLLIPEDADQAARSAVWGLASMANVYFWLFQDHSYFAQDVHQLPLLHLWSLGIEEQYYLLWPLLLLLTVRKLSFRAGFALFAAAAFLSYVAGDLVYEWSPSFAYYMLPTRAGELLIGGLVAGVAQRGMLMRLGGGAAAVSSWLGAVLIVSSLFLLSKDQAYPGWRALLPTAGAALVILSGQSHQPRINLMLAAKPLVWVGLLSYSAYLWHWPLMAFYRYGFGDIGPDVAAVIILATFSLAALTYRFVERPTRRSRKGVVRVFLRQYAIPSSIVGGFALFLIATDGIGARPYAADFEDMRPAYAYDYVCQKYRLTDDDISNPQCVVGAQGAVHGEDGIILWGDSHAAHYIGVVGAFARREGFTFRNIAHSDCPPVFRLPKGAVSAARWDDCERSLSRVVPLVKHSRVVVMAASWAAYQARSEQFMPALRETVKRLVGGGAERVVLLGQVPRFGGYDRRCVAKATLYPFLTCGRDETPISKAVPDTNSRIRAIAANFPEVSYFDIDRILCGRTTCSPFDSRGRPLYYDTHHLSMKGSWEIGEDIVRSEGVPQAFSNLAGSRSSVRADSR